MNITGCILAGGQGRRMGGQDKGLITYQGRPLIKHTIERLTTQVNHIIINANRHVETYASFGYDVIQDSTMEFNGPLAGIERGLFTAQTDIVVFIPCDSPHFPLNLVQRLYNALQNQRSQCAYVITSEGPQPVFCAIQRALHENLMHTLKGNNKKLIHWLQAHSFSEVFFENSQEFVNFNTQEELLEFNTP